MGLFPAPSLPKEKSMSAHVKHTCIVRAPKNQPVARSRAVKTDFHTQ